MNIKAVSYIIVIVFVIANQLKAIDLKPSPISSHFADNKYLLNFDEFDDEEKNEDKSEKKKSVSALKAGLFSAVLPGLGEYYVGDKEKARYFFAVEAFGWLGYIAFKTYSNMKKDDLINFAAVNAGASLEGKDDNFLDMVGFYVSIDDYNSFGRVFDTDRPYFVDNSQNHWRWQSFSDQSTYRNLKNRSREAKRKSEFMIGLVVLNRIVSVIDVIRSSKNANRTIDEFQSKKEDKNYKFTIDPFNNKQQLTLTILTDL